MTSDLAATPAPIANRQLPGAPPRRWRLRGRRPESDLASAPYPPRIPPLLSRPGTRNPPHAAPLIATADCGTAWLAEVAHTAKLGIDTIILDHHTPPPELPAAVALVNPKRPENRYPEPELASGGLAFKVMAALYESTGRSWDPEQYIDLVALSTVCDVAPLQNENRTLVRRGVAAL